MEKNCIKIIALASDSSEKKGLGRGRNYNSS